MVTGKVAPERGRRIFEDIYDQIRSDLASGALKPGDKLPAERELAEKLGFSRSAVREAIRALEASGIVYLQKGVNGGAFIQTGQVETVSIRNDAELHAFVMKIMHVMENPKTRDDLRQGKLRFSLGGHTQASSAQPSHRIERGAVTESIVKRAATAGATLVLSPEAVLTPLARDRARALGVTIEKEQP